MARITGFVICFVIVLSFAILCFFLESGLKIPEITGVSAFVFIISAAAVYLAEKKGLMLSVPMIIGVSVIIRLILFCSDPVLSDDINRYELDGKMLSSGTNPYSVPPAKAAGIHPWIRGIAAKVNHPELVTIYPPAAQLVFAAGSYAGGQYGIRLLLIILDSASIIMMIRIAAAYGIPLFRVILYAWNPLVVMETASSGHIDSAAVFFLVSAIYILRPGQVKNDASRSHQSGCIRYIAAGATLAFSFLIKLLPVIFLPVFLIRAGVRKSVLMISGFSAAFFILVVPFMPDILNGLKTLDVYARNWEFSGFVFRELRQLTGSGDSARMIIMTVFALSAIAVYGRAFMGKVSGKNEEDYFFSTIYSLCLLHLLLTPTLHPWYALYLASVLPFFSGVSGICMTFAVLLSYRVLIAFRITGVWTESDLVAILIFLSPIIAMCLNFMIRAIFCQNLSYKHRKQTS